MVEGTKDNPAGQPRDMTPVHAGPLVCKAGREGQSGNTVSAEPSRRCRQALLPALEGFLA